MNCNRRTFFIAATGLALGARTRLAANVLRSPRFQRPQGAQTIASALA
jgi:hypothetical protein